MSSKIASGLLSAVTLILFSSCQAVVDDTIVPLFADPVILEKAPYLSANAEMADFDGDGRLDIALAIGRHWPGGNRILFGDGEGGFARVDSLLAPSDRTYSISAVDMDGDGDIDLVVSNDRPDSNYILFNDGAGQFPQRMDFGDPDWPTRNSTVADLNGDGRPDIVVANRSGDPRTEEAEPGSLALGGDNYLCFNEPEMLIRCVGFSSGSATTIAAADLNSDGNVDLIVPYRDGGQSHVFHGNGSGEFADFTPFGPDDASFRAALAVDANRDGLLDIVAINDRERTTTVFLGVASTGYTDAIRVDDGNQIPYALEVADVDNDGHGDILVGYREAPSRLFLNRFGGNGDGEFGEGAFMEIVFGDSLGAAYGFDVGDINRDGKMDIAIARSGASDLLYLAR